MPFAGASSQGEWRQMPPLWAWGVMFDILGGELFLEGFISGESKWQKFV